MSAAADVQIPFEPVPLPAPDVDADTVMGGSTPGGKALKTAEETKIDADMMRPTIPLPVPQTSHAHTFYEDSEAGDSQLAPEEPEASDANSVSDGSDTPKETLFTREHTVMIFDWDDTLLPSTWLTMNAMRLDDDCTVPEELAKQLNELAEQVMKTLDAADGFGTVVIVTNAENGWIELSGRKFMPTLADYLDRKQFRIVSARSTYEPQGIASPFEWKNRAFAHEIELYYSNVPDCPKRNILSFGDSAHEREAIMNVTKVMKADHVTKSLKFVERPLIEQLRKEHELITGCMQQIVYHSVALDLCVRCS